jgi:hypothetical protein
VIDDKDLILTAKWILPRFNPSTLRKPYNSRMASWIVHLRIAEELLDQLPELDEEKFALGSVAPDSGKPDEKWEKFDPPLKITHFQYPLGSFRNCGDLEFYRQYLLPLHPNPDPPVFSFRLGYFFHLITDNLWSLKIGQPTYWQYKEKADADKNFIWEVKKDWYGLDFLHVRDHPDCIFWRVFCSARPYAGGLEFLSPEGLDWNVNHIQQYYRRTDAEVHELYNHPYIYLSSEEAAGFVQESCRRLIRIYKQCWIDDVETNPFNSALELEM